MGRHNSGIYRQIRYWEDPVPPLDTEDAAWADAILKERGLLP
jgi:hypothetical protein